MAGSRLLSHGFCGLHFIGYNRELDHHCPQCILGGIYPTTQYDFDILTQQPVDAAAKPILLSAIVP